MSTIVEVGGGAVPSAVVTLSELPSATISQLVSDPRRSWSMAVFESITECGVGNGTVGFCVPAELDGRNIVGVVAACHTAGTTGTMNIQIRRRRGAVDTDVLSTALTIDSGDTSSTTATTPAVINLSNDDLAEADLIYVDVDAIQGTPALGLTVTVTAT